jgi:4-hydroxybenzoate polyprenyltransferase
MTRVYDLIRLLRPRHWIKNIFIFAPLVFSLNLFEPTHLERSLICFAAFSFASSFSYILNDIMDRDKDRRHPQKRKRPIASGSVSIRAALFLASIALLCSIALSLFLNIPVLIIVSTYIILNVLYSLVLKNIVIIDVLTIALGFILRVGAGSYAIDVMLSNWILLAMLFISMFLGFGKRRNELYQGLGTKQRSVLMDYSAQLLDYMIVISVSLSVMTYSLYVVDPETVKRLNTNRLVYTIPFVVYFIFKYLYLIYKKKEGSDPAELVTRDTGIIVTAVLYAVTVIVLLYLGHAKLF